MIDACRKSVGYIPVSVPVPVTIMSLQSERDPTESCLLLPANLPTPLFD